MLRSDSRPQIGRPLTHCPIRECLPDELRKALSREILARNRFRTNTHLRHALSPVELVTEEGGHD